MNLGRHRRHLVTQTEINGQVGFPAPVVLHIGAEESLAKVARCDGACESPVESPRIVRVKILQGGEIPDSSGIRKGTNLKQHALDGDTEFERMGALGEEGVVVHLERVPAVEIDWQGG